MNGRFLNQVTSAAGSPTLVAVGETPGMTTAERIEALYLAALSRKPTAKELDRMTKFVVDGGTDRTAERFADVFWVLLNSAEFRLNH